MSMDAICEEFGGQRFRATVRTGMLVGVAMLIGCRGGDGMFVGAA